jgi:hypothetical protein
LRSMIAVFGIVGMWGAVALSEPVAERLSPPFYIGEFQRKFRSGEGPESWDAFLKSDQKTYALLTKHGDALSDSFWHARSGVRCVVKGEIDSDERLVVEAFTALYVGEEDPVLVEGKLTKLTANGSAFRRVSEADLKLAGVTDPKKFGEAWEDASGLIWGGAPKKLNGNLVTMNYERAQVYCNKLGAYLPTGWHEDQNGTNHFPNEDSDYVRFRKALGGGYAAGMEVPKGYIARVLADLIHLGPSGEELNQWFWSSTSTPDESKRAYAFNGRSGQIFRHLQSFTLTTVPRCVVRSK